MQWTIGSLLFLGITYQVLITAVLPGIIQSQLASLADQVGIKFFQVSNPHVGLSGLHIGFHIGTDKAPVLNVSSVGVSYSVSGLLRKKIKQISLKGLEFHCAVQENRLVVNDAGLMKLLQHPATDAKAEDESHEKGSMLLPFEVDRLVLEQATLICIIEGEKYRLPVSLALHWPDSEDKKKVEMLCSFYPRGQEVVLTGSFDLEKMLGSLHLDAEKINPMRFSDLMHLPTGMDLQARLDLAGIADVSLSPFGLTYISAGIVFHDPRLSQGKQVVSLLGKDDEIPSMRAKIIATQKDGAWSVEVKKSTHSIMLAQQGREVCFSEASFAGHGLISDKEHRFHFVYTLPLTVKDKYIMFHAPDTELEADVVKNQDGGLAISGTLAVKDGTLNLPSAGVKADGITMTIPVAWPRSATALQGEMACEKISHQGKELGHLKGKTEQQGEEFLLSMDFTGTILPGLLARFEVKSNFSSPGEALLNMSIPPYQLMDFNPAEVIDLPQAMNVTGQIAGKAIMSVGENGLSGSAELSLQQGHLNLPDREITIDGISTSITLPDLPNLNSGPAQKLHFDTVIMKYIFINDGDFLYSLESPESFFLEQGSFKWAEGSVHTSGIRFYKNQISKDLVLYCYKLKLATILSQMGIKNVTGDGTLNGRIPVSLKDGEIIFDESFLYSTPGEGGVVRIGESDYLTQSIPIGTPQFAQLDFAQEALRDFDYTWAKLHLVTEEENLVLQLKLDGKPAEPLPFVFDQSVGSFKRIEANQGQGIFQPIRLDVNFRFPLNTFLEYDQSVKEMFDSIP